MAVKTVLYLFDKQLTPHFKLSEFKCKDSRTIKYSEETIGLLETIFDICKNVGKIVIESGYRTPKYSVKVGGSKNDAHTVGIAADIIVYDKNNKAIAPKYIACLCQDLGFTGIGLMSKSLHVDTRTTKNYKNGKWWGDETKGKDDITDFYSYCKLSRASVNKMLGIEEPISITYQVYDGVWLSNVKDTEDFAGRYGHSISAILANLSKGDITYKVHVKGDKWLSAVENREDYAGTYYKPIDAVMFKTNTDKTIYYQVHIKGGKWLSYVTGYNEKDNINGYAGILGKEIDGLRVYLK